MNEAVHSGLLSRRLKLAGILVALGLIVEALTMFWRHPTAFLVFLFLGALLVAAGVLLYLSRSRPTRPRRTARNALPLLPARIRGDPMRAVSVFRASQRIRIPS